MYACVTDIEWITGHSYVVYGPVSNGATSVLFESIPNYPNPGEWLLSTVFYYIGAIVFDRTLLGDG